jgi:hypothetical protein
VSFAEYDGGLDRADRLPIVPDWFSVTWVTGRTAVITELLRPQHAKAPCRSATILSAISSCMPAPALGNPNPCAWMGLAGVVWYQVSRWWLVVAG